MRLSVDFLIICLIFPPWKETLTLDGNFMAGRAPSEVCGLRSEKLDEFIVDCPDSASNGVLTGTICDIPRCCTECI